MQSGPSGSARPNKNDVTRLSYGPGPSQFVLVRRPEFTVSSAEVISPLAVILHGGFWKGKYGLEPPTAAIETVAPSLLALGFVTAEVEYRRSLDAQWGVGFTDADVVAAYAACCSLPDVDAAKVVVLGHSAGGTLALSLLLTCGERVMPPPVLVVAFAPVADLCRAAELRLSDEGDAVQQYMRGEPAERPEEYAAACPARRAADLRGSRVLLVSGSNDEDVPASYVRDFFHLMDGADGWELMEMKGADHYNIVNAKSECWSSIIAVVSSLIFPS